MSRPFKMKGSPFHRNFGIGSPAKDKPTKQELLDAANNPNHPNSEKNMGKDAYYAWKAGGKLKEEPKDTGLTHGAGGTLVDEKGNVDEEASKENIKHLKTSPTAYTSPAKQVLVSDANKKAEGTSEKIGPERSSEGYKKLLRKRDDAAMNLEVSDEQAHKDQQEVGEKITEARKYRKTNPKRL